MTIEEIKQRLITIDNTIFALNKEKNELSQILIDSADTFEEKFRVWWDSDNKEELSDLIDKETSPHTRAYFDRREMNRYQTYDVCDHFVDELSFLLDPEEYAEYIAKYPQYALTKEAKEKLLNIAKEIYENNLGSFTCDW